MPSKAIILCSCGKELRARSYWQHRMLNPGCHEISRRSYSSKGMEAVQ